MSPRLEAAARYHRAYRRILRQASIWPAQSAESDNLLRSASIVYRAMVVEAHPEKAQERA